MYKLSIPMGWEDNQDSEPVAVGEDGWMRQTGFYHGCKLWKCNQLTCVRVIDGEHYWTVQSGNSLKSPAVKEKEVCFSPNVLSSTFVEPEEKKAADSKTTSAATKTNAVNPTPECAKEDAEFLVCVKDDVDFSRMTLEGKRKKEWVRIGDDDRVWLKQGDKIQHVHQCVYQFAHSEHGLMLFRVAYANFDEIFVPVADYKPDLKVRTEGQEDQERRNPPEEVVAIMDVLRGVREDLDRLELEPEWSVMIARKCQEILDALDTEKEHV